jgi:predicted nucleic acid-binding protein
LSLDIFICNNQFLNRTLIIYKENNISYTDAYLLAFSIEKKLEGIYSFDKGLDKVKEVRRFKPELTDNQLLAN